MDLNIKRSIGINMKWMITVIAFLLGCSRIGFAYDGHYPPFDEGRCPGNELKASPVIDSEKSEFEDGNLSISRYFADKNWMTPVIDIKYDDKQVLKLDFPTENAGLPAEIYYADLDGNRLPDIVITASNLPTGLGTFCHDTFILLQVAPGEFRLLTFESFYFGLDSLKDIVDLDGDGNYELLMQQLLQTECSDKRVHSFWVYVPYKIKDYGLMMGKDGFAGFPKFIQFTKRPNGSPTKKLLQAQKDEFLKSLPALIKSEPLPR